jgi:aerobic carbon-monoxide dehydrogenase medium subunit
VYAAPFQYYRATTLAEAHQLLKAHPDAKLLAGGHSLIPLMKLRLAQPDAVVDIGRISELKGITVRKDGLLQIGALTTHAELAASADVRRDAPALAEAAGLVGDPTVRNRGTIGGNVAHADPASDLPTVLLISGARFVTAGPGGERTIGGDDFFKGLMTTALRDDEVLTAVLVEPIKRGEGGAYVKWAHPASRYAVIGAAAIVSVRDGVCASARVAVGGLTPRCTRAKAVEAALAGKPLTTEAIAQAAAAITKDIGSDLLGDIYASAAFRGTTAPVYVARAISAAAKRAGA